MQGRRRSSQRRGCNQVKYFDDSQWLFFFFVKLKTSTFYLDTICTILKYVVLEIMTSR